MNIIDISSNQTISLEFNQLLIDIHSKTGKLVDWSLKKKYANEMAIACERIAQKAIDSQSYDDPKVKFRGRAVSLRNCGDFLIFKEAKETGEKRLHKALFCKYRLCPMCSWRRSLKNFGQLSQVMEVASSQGYRFLFATMSIQNCLGEVLKSQIEDLMKGYTKLIRRKAAKDQILGTMRTVEVTHNVDPTDTWYDTYNAHIHALFVVKEIYFKKGYIKQAKWLEYWKKSMKVSYDPHFHIKPVPKRDQGGAIRELSKYVTKSSQILTKNEKLTDKTIVVLDDALENKRLISYTGVLKEMKKELALDDVETGDLVNVDCNQPIDPGLEWTLQKYRWNCGYSQYVKSGKGVSPSWITHRFESAV